jgi:hypothetical protein
MTVAVPPWAPFRHRAFDRAVLLDTASDLAPYACGLFGAAQRTRTTDALGRLVSAHAATTGN